MTSPVNLGGRARDHRVGVGVGQRQVHGLPVIRAARVGERRGRLVEEHRPDRGDVAAAVEGRGVDGRVGRLRGRGAGRSRCGGAEQDVAVPGPPYATPAIAGPAGERAPKLGRLAGCRSLAGVPSAGVAGVLLAAGEGSRLGQPKALVEIGGQTLAQRGVALLRDGGAAPVAVVTGAVAVTLPGVLTVHNPDWRRGMGSSLAAGLAAVPDGCHAAVIALADQPLIGPEAVRRLIAAHAGGASIAVAAYHGVPRNPVLLAREHWAGVVALAVGDAGARPFLRAHPDLVTVVESGDTGRPDDLDTPADLERLARLVGPRGQDSCQP